MKDQMHVACGTYRGRREMHIRFFIGRKSKRPPGRPRSRHDNAKLNITGI
jgi:hypothetical protein